MNYAICVPTYKRKNPLVLNLLKCPEITLHFFVRQNLLSEGFYDDLLKLNEETDRVFLHPISADIHELGETREFIMQWCRECEVDYCLMLDDGVRRIWDSDERMNCNTAEAIENFIDRIEHDDMGELCVGMSFHKKFAIDGAQQIPLKTKQHREYFMNVPTQAVLLNVKRCEKFDLHYKSIDDVGFEDCAFFMDACKKGLVFASDWDASFEAIIPNCQKQGGSHSEGDNLELKYDTQMKRCWKYLGPCYGVSLQKRWREWANSLLTLIEVDCDYFYKALVVDREKNRPIWENSFKIL